MKTLTHAEVVAIVHRIRAADTEEEADALILEVGDGVPHPRIVERLYLEEPELSAEEVATRVLTYSKLVSPAPRRDD